MAKLQADRVHAKLIAKVNLSTFINIITLITLYLVFTQSLN
jgi:hypothetical protein